MKFLIRTIMASIVLCACGAVATAQQFPGTTSAQRRVSPSLPIAVTAIPFFTSNPDTLVVQVDYRISGRFFIFMRNESGSIDSAFRAHGELLLELRRENETSAGRFLRLIDLYRRTQPASNATVPDLQGAVRLTVPAGKYRVIISLDDKQSGRSVENQGFVFEAPRRSPETISLAPPLFAQPTHADPASADSGYLSMNRGGNILFGSPPGGCLLQVAGPIDPSSFAVTWKIVNQQLRLPDSPIELEGDAGVLHDGTPLAQEGRGRFIITIDDTDTSFKTLYVPLPLDRLEEGSCSLEVTVESNEQRASQKSEFLVLWVGKPYSLSNIDLAIDALRHIATEKELDEISDPSTSEKAEAFFQFWKQKDTDSTTAFNEVMVEYYRRVDLAIAQFSGEEERDGYRTDRGRILILYGTPSDSRRVFGPNQDPREVWTYSTLRKRFIFTESSRNGEYVLTKVEDL